MSYSSEEIITILEDNNKNLPIYNAIYNIIYDGTFENADLKLTKDIVHSLYSDKYPFSTSVNIILKLHNHYLRYLMKRDGTDVAIRSRELLSLIVNRLIKEAKKRNNIILHNILS